MRRRWQEASSEVWYNWTSTLDIYYTPSAQPVIVVIQGIRACPKQVTSMQPAIVNAPLYKTKAMIKDNALGYYCLPEKKQLVVVVPQPIQQEYGVHIQIPHLEVYG